MIEYSHNLSLAVASVAVSIVASMTALVLMNGIGTLSSSRRKAVIVMAAFVLGGGIWSMHFLAMLSLRFSVPVHYDLLRTLASGLIAVLLVGFAMLQLHFRERTRGVLNLAGGALGLGIVSMHFVGMLGMQGVMPSFNPGAIVAGTAVALLTGVLAVRVSYTIRSRENIVKGGVLFGLSVAVVHYVAMLGTRFSADPDYVPKAVNFGQDALAVSVTVASFCICGTFLLAASTFLPNTGEDPRSGPASASDADATNDATAVSAESQSTVVNNGDTEPTWQAPVRIPYEENRQTVFVAAEQVGALRADGRYTKLYTRDGVKFCPWSISEAEQRLDGRGFFRTHRSYLIKLSAVSGFEKQREAGTCRLDGFDELQAVPVSRARVSALVESLGL